MARCHEYRMAKVPADYQDFENEIPAWISTCVLSRTAGTHREIELVRGNPTLKTLWQNLEPSKPTRILLTYEWQSGGGARVNFTSPDVKPVLPQTSQTAGPNQPDAAVRVQALDVFDSPSRTAKNRPRSSSRRCCYAFSVRSR